MLHIAVFMCVFCVCYYRMLVNPNRYTHIIYDIYIYVCIYFYLYICIHIYSIHLRKVKISDSMFFLSQKLSVA